MPSIVSASYHPTYLQHTLESLEWLVGGRLHARWHTISGHCKIRCEVPLSACRLTLFKRQNCNDGLQHPLQGCVRELTPPPNPHTHPHTHPHIHTPTPTPTHTHKITNTHNPHAQFYAEPHSYPGADLFTYYGYKFESLCSSSPAPPPLSQQGLQGSGSAANASPSAPSLAPLIDATSEYAVLLKVCT